MSPKDVNIRPNQILVVEDDDALRDTSADILQLEGHTVEVASNGLQALRSIERELPSLILLDLRMPVMDGWEFSNELRDRGLDVPVIVMTASEAASEVAAEVGADDWVGKPYNLEELLRAVRTGLVNAAARVI